MSPWKYDWRLHAALLLIEDGKCHLAEDLEKHRLELMGCIDVNPKGDGTTYIITAAGRNTLARWKEEA